MSQLTFQEWQSAAAKLTFRNQAFIDGKFVPCFIGENL